MFADLGHFSYAAIQVDLDCYKGYLYFDTTCLILTGILYFSHFALADRLHFSGLPGAHTWLHGSSSLLIKASRDERQHQLLRFGPRYFQFCLLIKGQNRKLASGFT